MEDGWRIRGGAAEVKDYDVSQPLAPFTGKIISIYNKSVGYASRGELDWSRRVGSLSLGQVLDPNLGDLYRFDSKVLTIRFSKLKSTIRINFST